jgi:peptide/nickel transport system substrate-binding protein
MKKQQKFSFILILFISISSISVYLYNSSEEKQRLTNDQINGINTSFGEPPTFIYGVYGGPYSIDPLVAYGPYSYDVIYQVCEGLFAYNVSDPNSEVIPRLASDFGTWSEQNSDGTYNYTVNLRSGITFHDGTAFNATAVKWNFDRLAYFIENSLTPLNLLYEFYDYISGIYKPIINDTIILGELQFRFILNYHYAPFEALLSFTGSSILSPSSTPFSTPIDTATGDLVSTGPFVYDGYDSDEINFHAYEGYWRAKANIEQMKFLVINNITSLNYALISQDVHFIKNVDSSLYDDLALDPDIVLHNTEKTSARMYMIGMNNYWINSTFRQAISHAINYSYILGEILHNSAKRLKSPIPEGMRYSNSTLDYAKFNITKAREIMQNMGFGIGLDTEFPGTDEAAWISASYAAFNYTYIIGLAESQNLATLLNTNLDLIGIDVTEVGIEYAQFLDRLYEISGSSRDQLQLFRANWMPDFNDPYIILNELFTNRTSASNFVEYNGYFSAIESQRDGFDLNDNVQLLMEKAVFETNQSLRKDLYDRIQELLVEDDMPWAFAYSPYLTYAHHVNLTGFQQNKMDIVYFYLCNWTLFPNPKPTLIYIDENDPNYNWSKTATENEWCHGTGTWSDPYIIEDVKLDGEDTYNGILIQNSAVYFKIHNCTIRNGVDYGIQLLNANNSEIFNNTIQSKFHGIYYESSHNGTIYDNIIRNCIDAVGIDLFHSDHSDVFQNTIESCLGGIRSAYNYDTTIYDNTLTTLTIGIALGYTENNTIKKNEILTSSSYGIGMQCVNDTKVNENNIINSGDYGVTIIGDVIGCYDNTIVLNQIAGADKVGLALNFATYNNKIYLNNFSGNLINAQDNGTFNLWDYNMIGNSWDDYSGFDYNDDGIGDTPYLIDGTAGSQDNYPIFDDGISILPTIYINEPSYNEIFGAEAPNYDVSLYGTALNTTWYTLDDGLTNITFTSLTGVINQFEWEKLLDGPVTITFYVNNSEGIISSNYTLIYKDISTPEVDINSPSTAQIFRFPPNFDLTITDNNLDSIWYTIEGGFNFIANVDSGTIDQSYWNSIPDGQLNITFYANDTAGNIGYNSIILNKDTTGPIITINEPTLGATFGSTAPIYGIDVDEDHLDSIWYTVDDGQTNFTIMELTGGIDQNAWKTLSNGQVSIRFYANDTFGSIGTSLVLVYKDASTPSPPSIPGPNLYFIMIFSLIGILVILWQQKRKLIN